MSTALLGPQESSSKLQNQKLSPVISGCLLSFRSRLRQRKVMQLVMFCIAAMMSGFLLQFVLDRFIETPKVLRASILLFTTTAIGVACWRIGHRWFWKTRRLTQVAKLLKSTFPRLSDQVLSVVELAGADGEQRRSPELIAAAMAQVEKRLVAVDLQQALPRAASKSLAYAAAVELSLVIAIFVLAPGAAQNALARLLGAWSTTERFTFARMNAMPQQWIVASDDPFKIRVTLDADSDWRPAIASCRLSGKNYFATLNQLSGSYEFDLPGMIEDAEAHFVVGDFRCSSLVVPLTRPELTELNTEVELPSYLRYPRPIRDDARSGTLYLLPSSTLRLSGRANRKLSEVTLLHSSSTQTATPESHPVIESDRFHSEWWQVNEAEEIQLAWRDEYELENASNRQLKIRMVQDKLPQVRCQGLSQIAVWLASDTLKFEVSAEDDFGIANLGLQWRFLEPTNSTLSGNDPEKNSESALEQSADMQFGERVIATGAPELKKLSAQATFNCAAEKLTPRALELRVFAEDYRGLSGRTYSVPYVIRFMSAAEHADWIATQLRQWKGKLDGTHDNELQLLDENRELRQTLASGGTDAAGVKQKLSQQALDERGSADKLQRTIEEGRGLLEQALRNEELRSQQVESWASALERLNKIAQASMPSVADKLDQASRVASEEAKAEQQKNSPPSTSSSLNSPAPTSPSSDSQNAAESGSASLSQLEKSMDRVDEQAGAGSENKVNSNSGGGPSIPETLLGPGQRSKDEKQKASSQSDKRNTSDTSPSQKLLEQSIEEQMRLIDEFRQAKEAFGELLSELENSTFVKRFKAAAEVERQLAGRVNSLVSSAFGRPVNEVNSKDQESASQLDSPLQQAAENFERIQRDLEAYQRDNPAASREEILSEMKSLDALTKLKEMPLRLARNLRGDTLNRLDFWADTLDRWAEELAGLGKAGGSGEDEKPRDRLPPAILLEILRIIYDQIDLRDETRTLSQIVPKDEADKQDYQDRTAAQAVQQMTIQQRTLNTVSDIRAIPSGVEKFKEELQKLNKAVQHMDDASAMLVDGSVTDSGVTDETVSAQTAAIEALIESRRSGSGGGGGSSGGGSLAGGSTNRQPLDLVGPASDKSAKTRPRQTGEGTGKTGRVLPEEYRQGLDTFLNKLNQNRGPK